MREDIIKKLRQLKPILKERFGIEEFAIFGSVARGEANETSDVDIAIIKMKRKDPFLRLEAKRFLEKRLHKKVDIGHLSSLRPYIKKVVQKELVYV